MMGAVSSRYGVSAPGRSGLTAAAAALREVHVCARRSDVAQQLLTSDKLAVRDRGRDAARGQLPAGFCWYNDRDRAAPLTLRPPQPHGWPCRYFLEPDVDS